MISKKIVTQQNYPIKYLIDNVHIAPFQRLEDKEHSEIIYSGLLSYFSIYNELFLPNIISLAMIKDDEKMVVLDGQHRLSALKKLYNYFNEESKEYILDSFEIRTDVYKVNTKEDAREIYNIINSSKKVELYTGDIEAYIIPKILKYFQDRFSKYCKSSTNPRGLNINIDILAKRIQAHDVIKRLDLNLDNIDIFLQNIQKLNKFYSEKTSEELFSYGHKESLVKELKESNDDFYLGLYRKYEWLDRLLDNKPYHEQNHNVSENRRKRIPSTIRKKVWSKHFQLIKGECFCCQKELYMDDFECGHVIPVKDGGENTIENLEPVCRQCNLDMGTINMLVYKKLFF